MTKIQSDYARFLDSGRPGSLHSIIDSAPLRAEVNEASAIEQLAVFMGNHLQKLIKDIKQNRAPLSAIQHQRLVHFNELIERYVQDNPAAVSDSQGEIVNPYLQYYLTRLSRFNHLFNQINSIRDYRNDSLTEIEQEHVEQRFLSIPSLLLDQPAGLTMSVDIQSAADRFRPVYVYGPEDTGRKFLQYFYDPKTTPKGRHHQSDTLYALGNQKIFQKTQFRNAKGLAKSFFKQVTGVAPLPSSQHRHEYFKPADSRLHEQELAIFKSAQTKIARGLKLSEDEQALIHRGQYYRMQSAIKFRLPGREAVHANDIQVTHVSHASEVISIPGELPLYLNIDPVHYQSGTDGLVGIGAKLLYDRQTAPAFSTDGYPAMNVVLISHNHRDHLCKASIIEAFRRNPGTLFIVPKGDGPLMKSYGLDNVIEFESWNDFVDLTLVYGEKTARYRISALPAKHASNRDLSDLFASLYMGYMIQDLSQKKVVLCTGDTAVLDEQHFQELEQYLLANDLEVSVAAIAQGPDRPRTLMQLTHQSTADALAMHARFNLMNLRVLQQRREVDGFAPAPDFQLLQEVACRGIGYHQGCYCLGLLSLNDVPSTILRILVVLESLRDMDINQILSMPASSSNPDESIIPPLLMTNLHFCFMDNFEKKGLIDMLNVYRTAGIAGLTAGQVKHLICSHLHIPQPGSRTDMSQPLPNEGFVFNYQRLIVNRDPGLNNQGTGIKAYELFAEQIDPEAWHDLENASIDTFTQFIVRCLNCYQGHQSEIRDLLEQVNRLADFAHRSNRDTQWLKDQVKAELGSFYQHNIGPQDEDTRDEGELHTLLVIMAGLIDNIGEFRAQFAAARQNAPSSSMQYS